MQCQVETICKKNKLSLNYMNFVFLLLLITIKCFSFESQAKSCILMNGHSQKILFAKNQDEYIFPASTTKIVTALYVLKNCTEMLEQVAVAKKAALLTITPQAKKESNYRSPGYWLETDGICLGIKVGEEMVVKDLLTAMLVKSPNDAANVLADHIGGSIEEFMNKISSFLLELGLTKSSFINPHGLHHPMHRSTAYEMAVLTCEALKFPLFRNIIQMTSFHFPQTNLEYERPLVQTNRLVKTNRYFYPYCIGGKTGTTAAAGKCLVAVAEKEGRLLVACQFGCESREALYGDCIRLFEEAFAEKQIGKKMLKEGRHEMTVEILGKKRKVQAHLPQPVIYRYYPSEQESMKLRVAIDKKMPILKGEKIGEIILENETKSVQQKFPIYAAEKIQYSWQELLVQFVRSKKVLIPLAIVLVLVPLRRKIF